MAAKKEVEGCTYYQYLIYDHRGTVVKMVDENAESVGEYTYDAWGMPLHEEESGAENKFGWQSNWIRLGDYDGGLLLSPTRIYSAKEGMFLQRDPLGFVDGLNLYHAFRGNPVNDMDPFGKQPFMDYSNFSNVYAEVELGLDSTKDEEARQERKRIFIQIMKKAYQTYKDYIYLDIEKIEKAVEKTDDVIFESTFYAFISNFGGTGGADSLYHPLFKEIYYPHGKNSNRTGTQGWTALHEAIHALFHQKLGYFNVDGTKDHLFLQTYLENLVLGDQGKGIVKEIVEVLQKIEYYEKATVNKNQPAFDLNNICSQINRIKERLKELEIFEIQMKNNQIFQKRKQIVGFKQNLSEIFSKKIPQSIIDECKKLANKCGE